MSSTRGRPVNECKLEVLETIDEVTRINSFRELSYEKLG